MELADDQTLEDAHSLLAGLTANAASLTYKELQTKLALNAEALCTINQRRYDASEAIDAAKAALQAQEAVFLIESPGGVNPSHLRQWAEALDRAKAKAAHLRNQEARLTALAGVLSQEIHRRDQRREYLVRQCLSAKHTPHLAELYEAARVAVALVIAAEAWNSGIDPGQIEPLRFCANALQEHTVREAVARFVAAERTEAEKQVAADPMFGGGQS